MNSKRIGYVFATLLLGTVIWIMLPPFLTDKVVGKIYMLSNGRQCFNFHKDSLREPYTAYLLSDYILTKEQASQYDPLASSRFKDYDAFIIVRVQAKNGLGAYGITTFECPLVDGRFNETYALIHRLQQKYPK